MKFDGTELWFYGIMSIVEKGIMAKQIRANVSDEFHKTVKIEAAREGTTIKELVISLLKAWLKERGIEAD